MKKIHIFESSNKFYYASKFLQKLVHVAISLVVLLFKREIKTNCLILIYLTFTFFQSI